MYVCIYIIYNKVYIINYIYVTYIKYIKCINYIYIMYIIDFYLYIYMYK